MQPTAPPPPPVAPAPRRRSTPKLVLGVIVLLMAAFLAGYIPQRLQADRLEETLRTTKLDLELANLHRHLGIAALEARRNSFPNAAAAATAFFDGAARLASDPGLADQPRTRTALAAYARSRDEIAVRLGTADPQVAEELTRLYFTVEGVLSRRQ